MSKRAPYRRLKAVPVPADGQDTPALVEAHRDRVLDLASRGYLPSSIRAVTKLPIAVVDEILTTKAPPKRGLK